MQTLGGADVTMLSSLKSWLDAGDLEPTSGEARRSHALRVGRYAQHFVDALQMDHNPVEYLLSKYPTVSAHWSLIAHTSDYCASFFAASQPALCFTCIVGKHQGATCIAPLGGGVGDT
jgi:ATPase subunit of ABC transporter with duplicated ATPase domains